MKTKLILLFLLLFSFNFSYSSDLNDIKKKKNDDATYDLSNWVGGQILDGDFFMIFFNISQDEFDELVENNGINNLTLEISKKSNENDEIVNIQKDIIDASSFNIQSLAIQIENPNLENWTYLARMYDHENAACPSLIEIPILEIEDEEELVPELPVNLPEYNCGEDFEDLNITNFNPLESASFGQLLTINGFPVLLTEVSGGNGTFSGQGLIPIPFGNKMVKVEFNNISVNTDKVIYDGNVNAVSDDPTNYPDFNPDAGPLNIGGDICLPPPPVPGYDSTGINGVTGLNDWGFDENGINRDTGTAYDANGFDQEGNHVDTGTAFNSQGCSREGVDGEGQPCNPSGGAHPEAEAFAEENSESINLLVKDLINSLDSTLVDSLTNLGCAQIRTEMEALLATTGLSRAFIFGEGDKYFQENMHLEFETPPTKMILNSDRNMDVQNLEEKHIDLYSCDKTKFKLNAFILALDALDQSNTLTQSILDLISNWTEYEYNIYSNDPEKFSEWILKQIGILVWEESGLEDSYSLQDTFKESPKMKAEEYLKSIFEMNQEDRYYFNTGSTEMFFDLNQEMTLEELSFYYLNGDKDINGMDRAFFLEEMAEQQYNMPPDDPLDVENLLPVKLEKTVGNKTYTIYLDGLVFTPTGAKLDAYIIITDPETNKKLVFKALNLSFGPTGVQEESRLELASDVEIRLNNAAMLVLKGNENTYVAWDCEGFSSMGVDTEIEFCRDFLIPLNPTTLEPLPEEERYRLSMSLQNIDSWLEFYTVINAPPFAVAQYPDVKWTLTNMVLDFSSSETPQFTPLEGYTSPYWINGTMSPLWKGFYVEELSATLPNSFGSNDQPIVASAQKILIDGEGFTGGVSVENILSMENGNMAGWPISIEDFQLRIINNQFAGAGIGGQIKVPVFDEPTGYEAVMYPGDEISFTVSPMANVKMDMFLADVVVYPNSSIVIGKFEGEFIAKATLNGKMTVNSGILDNAPIDVEIPDITFQGFEVSNVSPYFSPGNWGLEGGFGVELGFNGFNLRLDNINPYDAGEGKAGVGFNLGIELGDSELSVAAAGSFGVEGELLTENGQQHWKYEKIVMNAFAIDATFPGAHISGLLEWYGQTAPDPVWGKGFRGLLTAEFDKLDFELKAAAQFGKKDDYKYFFVDALAELGSGIGSGAIQLTGFGGGISYHMDINQSQVNLSAGEGTLLPPLGETFSGASYSPDGDLGLGLKATVLLASASEEIFNGTVSLLFLFNENNSFNKISLVGSGQFMTEVDTGITPDFEENSTSSPASTNAPLTAYIDLTYNFDEPSFHGALQVYLDAGILHGAGVGNKMVDAEIHFDPEKWYIYIGRPEEGQRCGIIMSLPGLGDISATAYLDVGTEVPPMAPLPQNVQEIAYKINKNSALRRSGAGFVFGAAIAFDMEAGIAGIVEATLQAGAGFDVMVLKYEGLTCDGDPVGINGWYASGQMYAYVEGQLQVFGVNVLSAGIAAVLQARMPNPFFAQATVGVRVKILWKTFTKSLKLKLGNDCTIQSSNPSSAVGLDVITTLTPYDQAEGIETFNKPKALFALELDKNISIQSLNGSQNTFNITISSTTLTTQEGIIIPHTIKYNEDKTEIELVPYTMLPSNKVITFNVIVDIYKNGYLLENEEKNVTFTTGAFLDFIPETNVVSSYPIDGMANFYKNEYILHQGFINLEVGQGDLMINIPEDKNQFIRFTSGTGEEIIVDYEYDYLTKKITYPINPSDFVNDQMYLMEIVRSSIPPSASTPQEPTGIGVIGSGAGSNQTNTDNSGKESAIDPDQILYSSYFRTSIYNSLIEKLQAINVQTEITSISELEDFGTIEINGDLSKTFKVDPLMQYEARLNTDWFDEDVEPLFQYIAGANLIDIEDIKYAYLITGPVDDKIDEIIYNTNNVDMHKGQNFEYDLKNQAAILLAEYKSQIINIIFSDPDISMDYCMEHPGTPECKVITKLLLEINNGIPPLRVDGDYKVDISYQLPGGIVTTNFVYSISAGL